MINVHKLNNQFKNYKWGSPCIIPRFLDFDNDDSSLPYAEMWMGTHNGAPSRTELNGTAVNLSEISGELPFLLKLIAVEKPLSIQAHPGKEQAVCGYGREERAGIPLESPLRNYKDKNCKHEILCALSPFKLMAGFREPQEILKSFKSLVSIKPELSEIFSPLITALENNSLADFFKEHYAFSEKEMETLNFAILETSQAEALSHEQLELMKNFASCYKNDPAVLSPLYLNLIELKPYQAVFLPSGILHSYLSGFGLELMNNSDNVVRGGLTPKHADTDELQKIVKTYPYLPEIITAPDVPFYSYSKEHDTFQDEPDNDFSFSILHGSGEVLSFDAVNPSICIVNEGVLVIDSLKIPEKARQFKKGESFFIGKDTGKIAFKGNFSAFIASGCKSE